MYKVISQYLYFREKCVCPYTDYKKCYNEYFAPFGQDEKNWGPALYSNCMVFTFFFHCFFNKTVHRAYSIIPITIYSFMFFVGEREMSIFNIFGHVKVLHSFFSGVYTLGYLGLYGLLKFWKKLKFSKYFAIGLFLIIGLGYVVYN